MSPPHSAKTAACTFFIKWTVLCACTSPFLGTDSSELRSHRRRQGRRKRASTLSACLHDTESGVSLKYNRAKPAYTPAGVADSGNAFLPLSHKYLSTKFTRKFLNVNTAFHPLSGSSFNLPVINGLESTPCHRHVFPFVSFPAVWGLRRKGQLGNCRASIEQYLGGTSWQIDKAQRFSRAYTAKL